ncbi:hypothetical protein BB559_001748 [Furculomyces boomerangus]|uniref:Xylanolytic transcriptional activator regulatory domain-containing protein n=1 Tax=Furculomyces boomerangus TaxID=61424 RepID=A0A2T9Z0R8_9FUNG|nr:hypothetical protein BB559_001748 [Furculomyces boomerangus]
MNPDKNDANTKKKKKAVLQKSILKRKKTFIQKQQNLIAIDKGLSRLEEDLAFFNDLIDSQTFTLAKPVNNSNDKKSVFLYQFNEFHNRNKNITGLSRLSKITEHEIIAEMSKSPNSLAPRKDEKSPSPTTITQSGKVNEENSIYTFPEYRVVENVILMFIRVKFIHMMPIRLHLFLNDLKNDRIPLYFLYVLLASGMQFCWKSRDQAEINTEKEYSNRAQQLLTLEKNTKSPYYPWACVIFSLHYIIIDKMDMNSEYIRKAMSIVIANRYHTIDIPKRSFSKKKLTEIEEQEIEFKRRVFWLCFKFSVLDSVSFATPLQLNLKDIFTNLPKNDLSWRYGSINDEFGGHLMSVHVSSETKNVPQELQDYFSRKCKELIKYSKIVSIRNRKCLPGKSNLQEYEKGIVEIHKLLLGLEKDINLNDNSRLVLNPVILNMDQEFIQKYLTIPMS